MRLSLFTIVVVGILCNNPLAAQQADELVFSENTFDFGTVKEEDGPVIHEFSFINKGINPVKILGVKASCGCTTPDWTKDEVKPGETGYIQAQYNPNNRPGSFNKNLTVTTNASDEPVRLYIKGNVVPKTKSKEVEFSVSMGALAVKFKSFNMGKIKTADEPSVKEFSLYNNSEDTITFLDRQDAPAYIKLQFDPLKLAPKQEGTFKVVYDAKMKNDLGFSSDNVNFFTDEAGADAVKSISIYATIEEFFPPMTQEELEKAPTLQLEQNMHDFGKIDQKRSVSTMIVLTNTGKSEIKLRQAKSNCSCAVAKIKKETLKPGQSTEMEIIFNPEGRRGNQQKSITVYSNDPRASAQRVTIKAYITGGED